MSDPTAPNIRDATLEPFFAVFNHTSNIGATIDVLVDVRKVTAVVSQRDQDGNDPAKSHIHLEGGTLFLVDECASEVMHELTRVRFDGEADETERRMRTEAKLRRALGE